MSNRKDLPNERAANFAARLRETVQEYLGVRGDPMNRGITLGDLVESGFAKLPAGWRPGGAGSLAPMNPGNTLVELNAPREPDLTPPPQPDGFVVTAAISHILIEHAAPIYPQGNGHLRTRVFGATVASGEALPVFADAVEVLQFSGAVGALAANPATTWRLWIKWETNDGVLSPTPAGGTNGLEAVTGADVAPLLEALSGQITSAELAASLSEPIALINQPTTGIVAQLAAAQAERLAIQAQIADLEGTPEYDGATTYAINDIVKYLGALYRATAATTGNLPTNVSFWDKIGDYGSIGEAVAALAVITDDHETRIATTESGLTAETAARESLATAVTSGDSALSAAISNEATLRTTGDSTNASAINTLSAQVNSATSGLATKASSIELTTAVANETSARTNAISNLTATVTNNNTAQTAAVQAEATARASQTGELYAQYTVKTDVGGLVSGYGLASTANNAAPSSAFGVQASQFFVAPPTVNQAAAPTANLYPGYVWRNSTTGLVQYWTGSAWSTTPQALPFVVQAAPATVGGVAVAAGVYIEDAYIKNGTITNAKIANLAVDDAKIANVSVDKLTAGSIAVGQYIQSTSYVAGSAGWRINGNGTAEFSGVVVRGTVYATAGQIGGITIASNSVRAGQTAFNTGTGFHLGSDGRFSLGNSAGNRLTWDGTNLNVVGGGTFSGALSAAMGTFAGSLSAATGTFSGALSAATGTFAGNLSAAGGSFSGALSGATGTFSGSLTASAINAVNTINIAGNAVTVPSSAYTAGSAVIVTEEWRNMQSVTVSVDGNTPLFITASVVFSAPSAVGFSIGFGINSLSPSVSWNGVVFGVSTASWTNQPPAGTHTIYLVAQSVDSGGQLSSRNLMVLGVKR